jgi:hypothetical protein
MLSGVDQDLGEIAAGADGAADRRSLDELWARADNSEKSRWAHDAESGARLW